MQLKCAYKPRKESEYYKRIREAVNLEYLLAKYYPPNTKDEIWALLAKFNGYVVHGTNAITIWCILRCLETLNQPSAQVIWWCSAKTVKETRDRKGCTKGTNIIPLYSLRYGNTVVAKFSLHLDIISFILQPTFLSTEREMHKLPIHHLSEVW